MERTKRNKKEIKDIDEGNCDEDVEEEEELEEDEEMEASRECVHTGMHIMLCCSQEQPARKRPASAQDCRLKFRLALEICA